LSDLDANVDTITLGHGIEGSLDLARKQLSDSIRSIGRPQILALDHVRIAFCESAFKGRCYDDLIKSGRQLFTHDHSLPDGCAWSRKVCARG
jgi:hypothetical protein